MKDNESNVNRSADVGNELIQREDVDLLLVQDLDASVATGEMSDIAGIPSISTMGPWQAWMFGRGSSPDVGFPYSFTFFWGADDAMATFSRIWDQVATNKTVGDFYLDNPAGQAFADPKMGLPGVMAGSGYTRVDGGMFQMDTSDFSAQVSKFKEANAESLPDSLDFRRSQQAAAQERLLAMQRVSDELQDRRDRLVRVHEATGAAEVNPLPQQTAEERQLNELRNQQTTQLAVLSPENPKIKLLASQIAALEAIVDGQKSEGQVDEEGRILSAYEVQLADMDGQLEYMATQRKQIEDEMAALKASIEATPGNAITLDTLQRDYDNSRMQYDQAVANKARAETGDTIEALSKGQRVTVIEQAVAPQDPDRPNRPLIAAGGVVGGLALGLALVMLLEVLNRGIRRPDELTAKLGITAFATLPYMDTAGEVRLRRLRKAAILLAVLAAILALLWAVNQYYMPLDLLLDRVVKQISLAVVLPLTSA